jgi:hypothetical protein
MPPITASLEEVLEINPINNPNGVITPEVAPKLIPLLFDLSIYILKLKNNIIIILF